MTATAAMAATLPQRIGGLGGFSLGGLEDFFGFSAAAGFWAKGRWGAGRLDSGFFDSTPA